jgi:hypothetical protein
MLLVALSQFKTIFANALQQNEQAQQVKGLVADYDVHNEKLKRCKTVEIARQPRQKKDNWTNYLTNP